MKHAPLGIPDFHSWVVVRKTELHIHVTSRDRVRCGIQLMQEEFSMHGTVEQYTTDQCDCVTITPDATPNLGIVLQDGQGSIHHLIHQYRSSLQALKTQ